MGGIVEKYIDQHGRVGQQRSAAVALLLLGKGGCRLRRRRGGGRLGAGQLRRDALHRNTGRAAVEQRCGQHKGRDLFIHDITPFGRCRSIPEIRGSCAAMPYISSTAFPSRSTSASVTSLPFRRPSTSASEIGSSMVLRMVRRSSRAPYLAELSATMSARAGWS